MYHCLDTFPKLEQLQKEGEAYFKEIYIKSNFGSSAGDREDFKRC